MNLIFLILTTIFLLIGMYFYIKKTNNKKKQENIIKYSVIPSLIFSIIGHLLLSSKIRKDMNWGNSIGVVTLQRELGLLTLSLLVVTLIKKELGIGLIWGIFLLTAGLNHIITEKKLNEVSIIDIIYGLFLIRVFSL